MFVIETIANYNYFIRNLVLVNILISSFLNSFSLLFLGWLNGFYKIEYIMI